MKGTGRLVHCRPEDGHTIVDPESVAMHVPTRAGNGDETTSRLTEASGHKHLFSESERSLCGNEPFRFSFS